jgi:hypothetical protein
MTESIVAPNVPGPLWQRATLVVLALIGLTMPFTLVAGDWVQPAILLFIANGVCLAVAGNQRYKRVVLAWLSFLVVLGAASIAWA